MPRSTNDKPVTKMCIRLWTEDLDFLREMSNFNSNLGYNFIVRQIIHNYVVQMKDIQRKHIDQIDTKQVVENV